MKVSRRRTEVSFVLALVGIVAGPVALAEAAAQRRSEAVRSPAADVGTMLAGEALPARMRSARAATAKALDTDANLQGLLNDAAQTALALKKADQQYAELVPKIQDWQQRLERHNANRCTYEEGHPEQCAAYTSEAAALNAERDRLLAAYTANDQERRSLKSRLALQKARLRIAAALAFDCHCEGLAPEAAKACWDACFDRGDPRLRSCLDIADMDELASCLLSRR